MTSNLTGIVTAAQLHWQVINMSVIHMISVILYKNYMFQYEEIMNGASVNPIPDQWNINFYATAQGGCISRGLAMEIPYPCTRSVTCRGIVFSGSLDVPTPSVGSYYHVDGLMQEIRNSIALAMELRFSCINPLMCKFVLHICKVSHIHWWGQG